MFTGLIEDVGQIRMVRPGERSKTFTLVTKLCNEPFRVGESLAVNGACLTVVEQSAGTVDVTAVAETLERTNLGDLVQGARVNLERPMRLGDRLDGHLVLGHVDGLGRVVEVRPEGDAHRLIVAVPAALETYLVPKGSVAVDGISLTVADTGHGRFEVSVIPHTWRATALADCRPGSTLNLEMDIIGKYVARMVQAFGRPQGGLTLSKLAEHGFL